MKDQSSSECPQVLLGNRVTPFIFKPFLIICSSREYSPQNVQWGINAMKRKFCKQGFFFRVSVIKIVKRDEKITGLIVNWARYGLLLLGYSARSLFRTTICDAKRKTFLSRRDSWLHFLSLHYHINDKIIQHQFTNQVSSMTLVFFLYFLFLSTFIKVSCLCSWSLLVSNVTKDFR